MAATKVMAMAEELLGKLRIYKTISA